MKLTPQTLAVLKNFAQINASIWINQGTTLKTIATPSKNIFAVATVKDEFPNEFGIYDLNNFLSVLSLHKDSPELDFDDKHVVVKGLGGRSKISYRYTAKEMITTPPEKKLVLPSVDVTLMLEEDDYIWVTNAAKTLQSPNISVRSDGSTHVSLVTFDAKNDSAHSEALEVSGASGTNGNKFDMVFATDNWTKIIPGTYELKISSKGIAHFKHQKDELEYFIALEKNPTKIGE